jgi:hypothetical protein
MCFAWGSGSYRKDNKTEIEQCDMDGAKIGSKGETEAQGLGNGREKQPMAGGSPPLRDGAQDGGVKGARDRGNGCYLTKVITRPSLRLRTTVPLMVVAPFFVA